jgi:molybdopterin/thiamine biosynthesis adenylyltransferase
VQPLKSLATSITRGKLEGWVVSLSVLTDWAAHRQVNLRQAMEAALALGIFPECWERNFPSLKPEEQLQLLQSSVLVAGLGGLGGFLAEFLGRVGVGRLLLADGDHFTPPNLNRQLLATVETLGLNKARVTARHLQEINPAIAAEAIPHFLTPANLMGCLSQVQVVVDGLDTIATRRELFTAAVEAGVPLVHGAVSGKFGQVSTIMGAKSADQLIALHPAFLHDAASPGDILVPTVSLIASLQVQETIRLLLGQPPTYENQLVHFDGETGTLELVPLG